MKKKIFAFILTAALMTGTALAQSVNFSGYFNSGAGLTSVEDSHTLGAFGVDSERAQFRFRLNGAYRNEERTAGYNFRLQVQDNTSTPLSMLAYAYGYLNFFDSKLSLTGGLVDDSAWQTADWWINNDVGEGTGILLKSVNLIDGLAFGAAAYTNPITSAVDFKDVRYVFSASYTLADVFRVGASFRTENTVANNSSLLIGELRMLAVPNLTAVAAVSLDNLDDFSDKGNIVISETFAYKINDELNIGLNAAQFLYNRPAADSADIGFLFNLWGSYAIGNIIPRFDFVYMIGGQSHASSYHRRGYVNFSNTSDQIPYTKDDSVFSARPSVKINIDSKTHLEIGDVFYMNMIGNNSAIKNVFYIDFRWSF